MRRHFEWFGNPISRTRASSTTVVQPIDMRDADCIDGDATLIRVAHRFIVAFDLPRHVTPLPTNDVAVKGPHARSSQMINS
jgi:hypothetical protein